MLPLGLIHPSPYQPRTVFDEEALMGLSESIRRTGLLQPLSVRKRADGGWDLIAGERRLRAARLAGLSSVPCIEMHTDDRRAAMLGLIENVQRADLNPFEEAEAIHRLMDEWGVTQLEVAQRLGKAQSTVANKLRLLRLNPDQRRRILAAGLSERHARALLRVGQVRVGVTAPEDALHGRTAGTHPRRIGQFTATVGANHDRGPPSWTWKCCVRHA